MPQIEMHFAEDHPAGPGHFPGNPIIPGALLLDIVLHAICGRNDPAAGCAIRAAKFLRPVRPGDGMRIEWDELRGEAHFRCILLDHGDVAATGILRLIDSPK